MTKNLIRLQISILFWEKNFKDDDEEAMEQEEDPNLIQNEVEIEATKESEKMEE